MNIEVGHHVVERERFGWGLHKVESVSERRITYLRYGTHKGHMRREDIVFSGDEAKAKRLFDQLTSSRAQMNQEQNAAALRARQRDDDFIAKANS